MVRGFEVQHVAADLRFVELRGIASDVGRELAQIAQVLGLRAGREAA